MCSFSMQLSKLESAQELALSFKAHIVDIACSDMQGRIICWSYNSKATQAQEHCFALNGGSNAQSAVADER